MDNNKKLAHIVAYYLSRFDHTALASLGYKSNKEAFNATAQALGILPNYIKFRRDEFDVAHPHRKGWHKRPMTPSIINTVNALQDIDELTLRGIVLDILSQSTDIEIFDEFVPLLLILPEEKKKKKQSKKDFIPRNITGRKAEEIFMEWFNLGQEYFTEGKELIDMRDYGCGYDFQLVISEKQVYAIEVKGCSEETGGILISQKEWNTARTMKTDYYLVIVNNINNMPEIDIINNPYEKLSPKRNIQTVIQVNWTVSAQQLRQTLKNK